MTARTGDLTVGGITSTLLRFTLPMMLGSLMQQCYNIADTLIVGRCIGSDALAAVGSAYSLMTFLISVLFSLAVSLLVFLLARPLMLIFVRAEEVEIIRIGVQYLRVEGSFYFGIGILFLLYGYYRAIRMPAMSVVLTVLSLGTRVVLAYVLAAIPSVGVLGIWWSIPIGWALADAVGIAYYLYFRRKNVNLQKQ